MLPKSHPLQMKACSYAKKYTGKRAPTCGCDVCAQKYARRIASRIWSRSDMIGSSGDDCTHTVLRVLDEAGVIRKSRKSPDKNGALNERKLSEIKNLAFAWSGGGISATKAINGVRDVICGVLTAQP